MVEKETSPRDVLFQLLVYLGRMATASCQGMWEVSIYWAGHPSKPNQDSVKGEEGRGGHLGQQHARSAIAAPGPGPLAWAVNVRGCDCFRPLLQLCRQSTELCGWVGGPVFIILFLYSGKPSVRWRVAEDGREPSVCCCGPKSSPTQQAMPSGHHQLNNPL